MDKTVVELFAGVGGFRCGFNHVSLKDGKVHEEDNWDFVWANQWEPSTKSQAAFDCYVERFGESENHVNEDIATVDKSTIPNHTLLVGGFPCQDYSVARSLSGGKGIEGKKGVLWWQIAEVLEEKQPPFVLLENVDRLLRSPATQRGRDFGVMLRTLLDNGYSVEWRVINAAEYGFPQKRRRVFIFAYHESTNYYKKMDKVDYENLIYKEGIFAKNFPIQYYTDKNLDGKEVSIDEFGETSIKKKDYDDLVAISDDFEFHFFNSGLMHKGNIYTFKTSPVECDDVTTLGDIMEKGEVDEKYILKGERLEKMKYLKGSKKLQRKKPNGELYNYSEGAIACPDYLDRPARTMLTSESSINRSTHMIKDAKSGEFRLITPIEAERIQMFPDDWTNIENKSMTEKRRYFMMGNALVVGVVERLGDYISTIIANED
ncbi:MAG: DNA (cytosine-5-)-methyltransferase [Methanobrevibacter olleyae]|uniref:DNA (Cytosine-5-)-methyltransferase n=1 Tax=Methanobrevibacter olleyae TaxID=294671 RepID=A0A8T3VK23_METOL|nr:DNA (cytosine-5-)-methyltransferase [Methanobrevibacter olleyae]